MALPLAALIALGGLGGGAVASAAQNRGIDDFLFGSKGGFEQVSRFTPEQKELLQGLLPQLGQTQASGMDLINQLLSGDEDAFAAFEAPIKRQFQQEVVPQIAERFAGAGSHGAMSSSALQQTLGQSGRELSEQLAALRGNLQQNALGRLQGLMGIGFQPTFESVYRQPTMGLLGGLAGGIGKGAGKALGLDALGG